MTSESNVVPVAVVQAAPVIMDREATTAKVVALIKRRNRERKLSFFQKLSFQPTLEDSRLEPEWKAVLRPGARIGHGIGAMR